jgi:N-methylhydantoinase A
MVNIRLAAIGKRQPLRFPRLTRRTTTKAGRRRDVYLGDSRKPVSCPIYQRSELGAGARIKGPALIEEHGTTTVLFANDRCTVAASGELIIDVGGA